MKTNWPPMQLYQLIVMYYNVLMNFGSKFSAINQLFFLPHGRVPARVVSLTHFSFGLLQFYLEAINFQKTVYPSTADCKTAAEHIFNKYLNPKTANDKEIGLDNSSLARIAKNLAAVRFLQLFSIQSSH